MEFIDYTRSPSGDVQLQPDAIDDIFGRAERSEITVQLDAEEQERARRLVSAGAFPYGEPNGDRVTMSVTYIQPPVAFGIENDGAAAGQMDELEALLSRVPLQTSPALCACLLTGRLLDILTDAKVLAEAAEALAEPIPSLGATHVASVQSRGWPFAAAAAQSTGLPLIPVLKKEPRPDDDGPDWESEPCPNPARCRTDERVYVNKVHVAPGARVLLVDDWIESGATANATRRLLLRLGADWAGVSVLRDLPEHLTTPEVRPVMSLCSGPRLLSDTDCAVERL